MTKKLVTLVVDEANFNEATERWDIRLYPQDGWLYYGSTWSQNLRVGHALTLSLTEDWVAEVDDAPMEEPAIGTLVKLINGNRVLFYRRLDDGTRADGWYQTGSEVRWSWSELLDLYGSVEVVYAP